MQRSGICSLATFALAFGLLIGTQSSFAQVLARAGSVEITEKDFKEKYSEIRSRAVNPPTPEEFLEDLIRYEIGLQEARKRKLENDPAVQQAMNQALYRGFLEKAIGDKVEKIKVNEKEMRAFYSKNPEIRTSHILISVKPVATPKERTAARQRAMEIYKEVSQSKRPFTDLVKLYSDDSTTKATGGDL
ncbi:MAG: peptidylprolyl isomerase, partial [Bdellovibrionales bacterium]|nr:peptidylprolyl isomerase [Bdellovibrionales bacterium]